MLNGVRARTERAATIFGKVDFGLRSTRHERAFHEGLHAGQSKGGKTLQCELGRAPVKTQKTIDVLAPSKCPGQPEVPPMHRLRPKLVFRKTKEVELMSRVV